MNYTIKFHDFIMMYNTIKYNLMKTNLKYKISFYYLNNYLNIEIDNSNERIFKYSILCSKEEYDFLTWFLGCDFINSHEINIAMFANINEKARTLYYKANTKMLDYDNVKIHIIRDNFLELNIYYFEGLNKIGIETQDKALKKIYEIEKNT